MPKSIETLRARADAGFYCWDAVKAYTELNCEFVIVARKTDRLLGELQAAEWRSSAQTDADFECQFQPGSDRTLRWVDLPACPGLATFPRLAAVTKAGKPIPEETGLRPWTDDDSNLFQIGQRE